MITQYYNSTMCVCVHVYVYIYIYIYTYMYLVVEGPLLVEETSGMKPSETKL